MRSNGVMFVYYTYLIGWSQYKKYYYGVRFSRNAFIGDLWITYFTSSKHVKNFRDQHGEPDIITVRKIFNTKQKAIDWESKVLRRLNVHNNDKWLNIASLPCHWFSNHDSPSNKGVRMSDEQKAKISKTRKERGLGVKSAKNLKPKFGNDNAMKNPVSVAKLRQKATGRKRLYRPDGSWTWKYPD